jgi:arsenite-transporting ATPase
MREIFDEEMMEVVKEQLNSPCTEEIAAFDRFIDFMDDDQYEVVIFDTAPTGHTIRLLELPVDWSQHIEESAEGSGQTCMGPVQNIQDSKEKYDRAIALLKDEDKTEFIFVLQPEGSSIRETMKSSQELAEIGVTTTSVIVNGILPEEECTNPFFKKRYEMQQKYLQEIEEKIELPTKKMKQLDREIKGINMLKKFAALLYEEAA